MSGLAGLRALPWLICAATAIGCGVGRTSHTPRTVRAQELVWQYDGELYLVKDGRRVSDDALAAEVNCVPASVDDVHRSDELGSSGATWEAVGAVTLVLTSIAGTALIFAGIAEEEDGLIYGGLATLGGGLVIGATFSGVGAGDTSESRARRLDAVNRYNDAVYRGACGSAPAVALPAVAEPTSPAPPTEPAAQAPSAAPASTGLERAQEAPERAPAEPASQPADPALTP